MFLEMNLYEVFGWVLVASCRICRSNHLSKIIAYNLAFPWNCVVLIHFLLNKSSVKLSGGYFSF